ncbi:MAG: hypothetical protein QXV69_00545 [Sulfolobaceae archaeon]
MSSAPDFLRHIVSKILTPNSMDIKRLEDARRLLAKAEAKYKFSSYGGDPSKLADYLKSPDFIELVIVIGIDLAEKLLLTIMNTYKDEKILSTVKKVLEELKGFENTSEESSTLIVYNKKY